MTNQSTSEASTEDFFETMFSDDSDTDTDESSKNEATEETTESENEEAEETQEEVEAEPFVNVRYNGADKGLTQEETVMYAQKGMNYDKVKGQLDSYRNSPALKAISEIAAKSGMTIDQYAERLREFSDQQDIARIAKEYQSKHPDVDDDAATEYANAVLQNKKDKEARDAQQRQVQAEQAETQTLRDQVQKLWDINPDIDIEHLDTEVIDDINAGIPLVEAYLRWENKTLKTRAVNDKVNAKNKQTTNTGISSNNSPVHDDPFLQGLFGK